MGPPKTEGADEHERESLLRAKDAESGGPGAGGPSSTAFRPATKPAIPPMKALTGARGVAAVYVIVYHFFSDFRDGGFPHVPVVRNVFGHGSARGRARRAPSVRRRPPPPPAAAVRRRPARSSAS